MTPHPLGRVTLLVALAVFLLAATILIVPGPAQIFVALLTLPVGAHLLAGASSVS